MKKNDMAGQASPAPATLVIVGAEAIEVLGTRLNSVDELWQFLVEHKIERIDLKTMRDDEEDSGRPFYERIGKIIYGATRIGIEIERIDGKATSDRTPAPP